MLLPQPPRVLILCNAGCTLALLLAAIGTLAYPSIMFDPTSANAAAAASKLATPRWALAGYAAALFLLSAGAGHQLLGLFSAGQEGRKSALIYAIGGWWAAHALAQACALALGATTHVAGATLCWLAAAGCGVMALARLAPQAERLRLMESAKPMYDGTCKEGALLSREASHRNATLTYVIPCALTSAWAVLEVAQGLGALLATLKALRPDTQESIACGLAVCVVAASLMVLHHVPGTGGVAFASATMALLTSITIGGASDAWMPRSVCGALSLMIGMRIAAHFIAEED